MSVKGRDCGGDERREVMRASIGLCNKGLDRRIEPLLLLYLLVGNSSVMAGFVSG